MIKTKKRLDRKRDANANANAAAGLNRCFSPGTGRWWAAGSWDYLSGACSPLLEWWAAGRRWGWTCTRWVVEQRRNQEVSCAKTEQGRDSTVNPCPPPFPTTPRPSSPQYLRSVQASPLYLKTELQWMGSLCTVGNDGLCMSQCRAKKKIKKIKGLFKQTV